MGEESAAEVLGRRLPLYAYLERIWSGRRVLEIGRDVGAAEFLKSLGAAKVVTAQAEPTGRGERFDVVVVPEADAFLQRSSAASSWRALLADGGRLVVAVNNGDRPDGTGGVGYYELRDALAVAFPFAQMVGVTPFAGVGLVEFEGSADGLRIDSRLIKAPEPPVSYVAIGGSEPLLGLGYALVQVAAPASLGRAAGPVLGERDGRNDQDDRRDPREDQREREREKQEMVSQAESAVRVARAQADEIEELRGRLRRAAEDRASLDAENAKLRRGLAEADESVMTLTRRTAAEMAAMTERLASGLRAGSESDARVGVELQAARDEAAELRAKLAETEARAAAAEQRLEALGASSRELQAALEDAQERLRLAENELSRARRDAGRFEAEARAAAVDARAIDDGHKAVAARDERIVRLEGEKQDLLWRLAELEDKLRQAIARAVLSGARGESVRAESVPGEAGGTAPGEAGRQSALEAFHRAATAHVEEITRLRASISEQAALVAELEEAVASAESRADSGGAEAATLRQTVEALAKADGARRSRLAELEGKLLRLEHEHKVAVAVSGADEGREPPATNGHPPRVGEAAADEGAGQPAGAGAGLVGADAALLENRLGNTRERAARLRDDLEGVRRRLDSLSASEISGFLEELGEDLAELER